MRHQFLTWILMALIATAGVCTSCSNDNEPQPEESAQNPAIEQMKQVWKEVGQEMKSIDPAPLNQLIAALNAKGTKMTTRTIDEKTGAEGEETEVSPDLVNDLKELLNSIFLLHGDEPGMKHSLSFANAQNTFALLYEMQQIYLKEEGENPGEGMRTIHALGITVIPNDTTKYDIVLGHELEAMDSENPDNLARNQYLLTIKKNDAHFLDILTYNAFGETELDGLNGWKHIRGGYIDYLEHKLWINLWNSPGEPLVMKIWYLKNDSELIDIKLEINRNSIATPYLPGRHSVDYVISLKEDLVTLDGRINNLSILVAHAAVIGLTYKNGTTEAACVKLANDFNDNVTANIAFAGTDLGDILLGYRPVEGSVNYKPVIEVSSPILGDTPLSIDEILDLLGVTWDDIKGMIGSLGDL